MARPKGGAMTKRKFDHEILLLQGWGEDCAVDKVYEFLFVGPAIPITGTVGSPTNLLGIK